MFGLGEQIGRDPARVDAVIGGDDHLGRPGDRIDADVPEHQLLGGGDIGVPRADDLVDAGTLSVPYAIAAIACAPPITNTRSTPARRAAASVSGDGPGVVITISRTPATRAGMAVMITVDG